MTADEKTRFVHHVLELLKREPDPVRRVELAVLGQRALGLVTFYELNAALKALGESYAITESNR